MGKIMNRVFEITHKASGQSQANQTQQKETEKKKLRQTIQLGNVENGNFKIPKQKRLTLGEFSVCPEK